MSRRKNCVNRGSSISYGKKSNSSGLKAFIIILIILLCLLFVAAVSLIAVEFSKLDPSVTSDLENINQSSSLQTDKRFLILVNQDNPLAEDFQLNLANYNNITCDSDLITAFKELQNAAKNEGFDLTITRGYTDKDTQQKKHDELVENFMASGYTKIKAESEASKLEPNGGCSELQTGLAIDINKLEDNSEEGFASSNEYNWLYDNCVYYGFILRYPEDKEDRTAVGFNPQRYRFIGKDNAIKMRALNMSFEEYHDYMSIQNSNYDLS